MQKTTLNAAAIEAGMARLLAERAERLPFLQPAWLRTWLAEFGSGCEPLYLACDDGDLTGVAPLMRQDNRLSFIGDPQICDYMDFLVDPQQTDAAYAALWQQIRAEEWTELDLWGLRASSPTRAAIPALAGADGYDVGEELEAVAPRLDLPSDWEEAYFALLDKKDRHELRRKIRRVFESGGSVALDVFSQQADVVANMDTFLDLHTRSRQDKTDFMTPEMESFFRRAASALAADGLIRLFLLRINSRPAASVLCFDAGSQLYLYNSGYDPEFSALSVGLVSKALCLKWAIENGKQGFDLLRGDEPYKYDLGAHDQQIFRLQVRR